MPDFDPFASGGAVAVSPAAVETSGKSAGFSPFASGAAVAAPGRVITQTPVMPRSPDADEHWRNLYGGLDGLDKRVDHQTLSAFTALDKISRDPSEDRARAINQAFVREKLGDAGGAIDSNWPAVKSAFAKSELSVDSDQISDKQLYGWIGARINQKQSAGPDSADVGEVKPWTWVDTLEHDAVSVARAAKGFVDATFTNKLVDEIPDPPADLPDMPQLGVGNPAVLAGIWKLSKPILSTITSPGGAALGIYGESLAALRYGKQTLAGIAGLFGAQMGYATATQSFPEAQRVFKDPNATTQDKIAGYGGLVRDSLMTLAAGFGAAYEMIPERAKAVSDATKGKTPTEAAEVLRKEAATMHPDAANAFNQLAGQLRDLGRHEDGISTWENEGGSGPERLRAAAVRHEDGTVEEAPTHAELPAEGEGVTQGFVTDQGRFVPTAEARPVAEAAGQLAADAAEETEQPARIKGGGNVEYLITKNASEGQPHPTSGLTQGPWRATRMEDGKPVFHEAFTSKSEAVESARANLGITSPTLRAEDVDMSPPNRSTFGQTALNNAHDELERVAYGFNEATATERRAMPERWVRAGEVLERDPEAGARLAEALKANPNLGLTDDQAALLLRHKVRIENALNEAADIAADAEQPDELRLEARRQMGELSDKLLELLDASRRRRSEWGREGRWMQAIAHEDYSFATQETLLRASKRGAALTDNERAGLEAKIKELTKAQAELAAKVAERPAGGPEVAADRAVREMAKPPREPRKFRAAEALREKLSARAEQSRKALSGKLFSPGPDTLYHMAVIGADHIYSTGLDFAKWSTAMIAELGEKARPVLAEVWEASRKMFYTDQRASLVEGLKGETARGNAAAVASAARQIARAVVEGGTKDREAVIDAVWEDLKGALPDLTRREAMDAISGYGRFKPLSRDEVDATLRDIKGQMQQVAKIEDMAAGQAPKKTGMERKVPSDEERRLIQQVEAAKKLGGYEVTDPERELRSALQAAKRGVENRIKDLAAEFETGEGKPKGTSGPSDAALERLRALRDRMAKVAEQINGDKGMTPEERIKRAVKAAEKTVERMTRELQDGKIFPDQKTSDPWSKDLGALKTQIEDLKKFREALRKAASEPEVLTVEEAATRALEAAKNGLKAQIEKIEQQLAVGARFARREGGKITDSEVEALRARKAELEAEMDRAFGRRGISDEQRLNIWKAGARKRVEELQRRIAEGDFEPKPRRPAPAPDREADALRAHVERLKQDFAIERMKAEEAAKPGWQRALGTAADAARASAISGYHTLLKLAAFSLARFAETPVTEALGSIIKSIPGVQPIARLASREVGAEYEGIARFYAEAATQGMRDAWETLRTGKSGVKAELGDWRQNVRPVRWYDYFGLSHMVEKSPLLRGDFELRKLKGYQSAIASGLDVTNPMVEGAIRRDAFAYAQRAILQENNMVSDALNAFHQRLEAENPKLGRPEVTKVILSTFIKAFLTKGIVKTPVNYIWQTFERSPGGLVLGTAKAVAVHVRGVDKLTPEEADTVLRLLKVGSVGTAMFLWGAIDATKKPEDRLFGGYYQPGENRGDVDVSWGKLRLGGHEFSHLFTHNPLTESAQMGSTLMRVAQSKLRKNDPDTKGVAAGLVAAILGLASEAPIANPLMAGAQQIERGEGQKILWDEAAGLVPQMVQNLASDLDSGSSRQPKNFSERMKMTVPGLRSEVAPTSRQRRKDARNALSSSP